MRWHLSWKADPRALPLADRHYNRHARGARQFAPPGETVVLLTADASALWVSTFQRHASHAWPSAWLCSLFRNEGPFLSSELILEAVAATRAKWGRPPADGMVTFVDPRKVRPKRDPGRCFRRPGFEEVGRTIDLGLVVLQLEPGRMPGAEPALSRMFGTVPLELDLGSSPAARSDYRCGAVIDDLGRRCRAVPGTCRHSAGERKGNGA